jgi:predicted pyridoxine 5'-phosphate oxidase superfamily flavin-nucleotide-binding protein
MYHEGNRRLQDQFESRRIADRLEEKLTHFTFSDTDRAFIEGVSFFFLATANAEGQPDCSFKGGTPGFVRIVGEDELAFPDYDGNGMFKSLGNILVNPAVGLLFIDMVDKPRRLRVNGMASVSREDPLMRHFAGAQLLVCVTVRAIFPNCPRYIVTPGTSEPPNTLPVRVTGRPSPPGRASRTSRTTSTPGRKRQTDSRSPERDGSRSVKPVGAARCSRLRIGSRSSACPSTASASPRTASMSRCCRI